MRVIIDTREQCPLDLTPYSCTTEAGTLYVGDYAPRGLESLVAVERKSLPDLIGSLTSGRERFAHEMERARGLALAVVIEGSMGQVRRHEYRSKTKPHAIFQSVLSWSMRYGVHFLWCDDAAGAAYHAYHWMRQFVRIERDRLRVIARYHAEAVA